MLTYKRIYPSYLANNSSKWTKIIKCDNEIKSKDPFQFFYQYSDPVFEEFVNEIAIKYFLVNINKSFSFLCEYYTKSGYKSSEICTFNDVLNKILSTSKKIIFFKKLTGIVLESIRDNILFDLNEKI